MTDAEAEKRVAAYRAELDQAIAIVSDYLSPRLTSDEDARRAYQAFVMVKTAARTERTTEFHLGHRLQEIAEQLGRIERRVEPPVLTLERRVDIDLKAIKPGDVIGGKRARRGRMQSARSTE